MTRTILLSSWGGRVIVSGLLMVVCSGCGEAGPEPSYMARDSLGIEIVESSHPAWSSTEGWSVDPTPMVDLAAAGTTAPYEFFRLRDATRLADGGIVVGSQGSADVRWFDPAGGYVSSFGVQGEGPGEFQRLTSVHQYLADSILVFDYWAQRVTVLAPDGSLGRVAPLRPPGGVPDDVYTLPDGRLILHTTVVEAMDGERGRVRLPQPLLLFGADGSFTGPVAVAAGLETHVTETGDAQALFSKASQATTIADHVIVGDADLLGYDVYGLDGGLERVVRVPDYDLEISAAEGKAASDAIRALRVPPQFQEVFERVAEDVPTHRPAYSALVGDALGNVWLGAYEDPRSATEVRAWQVFDPTGAWLGAVELPGRFEPYEIGSDYLLGRSRDELDVETVLLLALQR